LTRNLPTLCVAGLHYLNVDPQCLEDYGETSTFALCRSPESSVSKCLRKCCFSVTIYKTIELNEYFYYYSSFIFIVCVYNLIRLHESIDVALQWQRRITQELSVNHIFKSFFFLFFIRNTRKFWNFEVPRLQSVRTTSLLSSLMSNLQICTDPIFDKSGLLTSSTLVSFRMVILMQRLWCLKLRPADPFHCIEIFCGGCRASDDYDAVSQLFSPVFMNMREIASKSIKLHMDHLIETDLYSTVISRLSSQLESELFVRTYVVGANLTVVFLTALANRCWSLGLMSGDWLMLWLKLTILFSKAYSIHLHYAIHFTNNVGQSQAFNWVTEIWIRL